MSIPPEHSGVGQSDFGQVEMDIQRCYLDAADAARKEQIRNGR